MYDMVELPTGTLLFGGIVQEQLQEFNATVAILDYSEDLMFDTVYPQLKQQCGTIQSIATNDSTKQLITIRLGCLNNNASGLLFQTLDYNGVLQ